MRQRRTPPLLPIPDAAQACCTFASPPLALCVFRAPTPPLRHDLVPTTLSLGRSADVRRTGHPSTSHPCLNASQSSGKNTRRSHHPPTLLPRRQPALAPRPRVDDAPQRGSSRRSAVRKGAATRAGGCVRGCGAWLCVEQPAPPSRPVRRDQRLATRRRPIAAHGRVAASPHRRRRPTAGGRDAGFGATRARSHKHHAPPEPPHGPAGANDTTNASRA